ncbi:LA motif RNA-binding protein [Acrasis kona]|uniref:LA motif RNA-binding protein n=1 Tax=Acrasis kona TaxID=1008807 RepID=A0AAW2YRI3_9EUKA
MSTVSEEQNKKQNAPEVVTEASPAQKKLGEELLDAIRKQVEYYFSRQNLANDPFLVQHMNNQLYVPIDFIANFKLVKNLTEDVSLIREAIRKSTTVVLDETEARIKPNFNLPRNTVILRDIPSNTNIEDVRKIFSTDNMPTRIQSQIGDNWFVVFETDDQALLALDQIRGKMVGEYAVQARIKTENILKAFTHGQPSQSSTYQPNPYAQPHQPQGRYQGRNYDPSQQPAHDQSGRGAHSHRGSRGGQRNNAPHGTRPQGNRQPRNAEGAQQPATNTSTHPSNTTSSPQQSKKNQSSSRPNSSTQAAPASSESTNQQDNTNARRSGAQSRSKRTSNAQDTRPPTQDEHTPQQQQHHSKRRSSFNRAHPAPSLGVKNFPPLPTISKADLMKSGYENDKYISYPKGAIISVYNTNLKSDQLTRPEDLPECAAVLKEPKQQLELTKPPLPHHEVQQHPEHVQEVDQQLDQEQSAQQEQEQQQPSSDSSETNQQQQPSDDSNQQQHSHDIDQQPVVKSFAEAAINAKDIRITKEPRVVSAGGNASASADHPEPHHPKKRRNSINKKSQEKSSEKSEKPKKKANKDNKDNSGGASAAAASTGEKKEGESADHPPRSNRSRRGKKSGDKQGEKKEKTEGAKKNNEKEQKEKAPAPIAPVDPKSYAAIVNRNKETLSPKPASPQESPRNNAVPAATSPVTAESPTGSNKKK